MAVPAAIWSGCGDDEGGGSACTPRETQQCLCSATVMGVQRCSEDGSSFEDCNCNPAGTSGAGGGGGSAGSSSGGSSGAAGAPMQAPFTGATGLPCETDTDCAGGLTCLPSSTETNPLGTGGVQRGMCTSPCVRGEAGSETCRSVDSVSECLIPTGQEEGICYALCQLGVANASRCGGRVDMACIGGGLDPNGQIGFCRPQCSSDVDCGGGRFCDLGTGFCVDALPARGPGATGATCTAATELTDCISGLCFDIEADGSGFCTAPCVLGAIAGCGFSANAAPREAACFPLSQNAVVGDRGLCIELCDVQTDCAQADYDCVEQSVEAQEALGRFGQCIPPEAGADAGADGG